MEISAEGPKYTIRRAEPGDLEAVTRIFQGPKVVWGTLQLPYPSAEFWRKRLTEPADGYYGLLACVEGEVVGEFGLLTFPRRRAASMPRPSLWQFAMIGRARGSAAH